MALTTVEVHASWPGTGSGDVPRGSVRFTPKVPNRSPATDELLAMQAIEKRLVDGEVTFTLWATDDPQWAATPWTWEVFEDVGDARRTYEVEILSAWSATGVELADIAPSVAVVPAAAYVTTADLAALKQDANHVHSQGSASDTWTINHNLGKRVAVSLVDSAGTVMHGEVDYVDDNTVVATFSAATGGFAYCN